MLNKGQLKLIPSLFATYFPIKFVQDHFKH